MICHPLPPEAHSVCWGPKNVCINDLPLQINSLTEPILFADDTSVIISNENFIDFTTSKNQY